MSPKDSTEQNDRREEIRGIFVLGLLAALVTVRIQNAKIMVTIGQVTLDAVLFLDATIVLWSFYAFFMVLGLSEDIVGESMAAGFRQSARTFLTLYFIMMAIFALIFGFYAYPTRLIYALGLLGILGAYVVWERLKSFKKNMGNINIRMGLKALVMPGLILTMFFSFMFVMFGANESWVLPAFFVGAAAAVIFLIVTHRRQSKRKQSENLTPSPELCPP
jgi:hypothetical protein